MKTKYIFFSLVALCMLSACTKDEEVAITTVQINNLSIAPQYTRSAFACDLVANSPIADVELQYSTDPLFGEGLYQTLLLNSNEHHYTANLEFLQQGQTYYVRYKVFNSFNSMIPVRVDTFRTRAYTLPSVRTDSVTHITTHSADCYFTLTDWGCDSLPIVGVCFSTSLSDRTNIPYTTTLSDSTFVCSLSDLTDGKTYSVCAFAKNAQGTAYSEKVIKFTTIAIVPPTITTADVTAISYTSAVCGGDISSDGNAEVKERGICYGTTAQPTTKDSVIVCGSGTGAFSTVLPNLQDGTTYYVRAFATNSKGTAYGDQKIFTTTSYYAPTVSTNSPQNISFTTTTCGGKVLTDGALSITDKGICYGTSPSPTINSQKISCGTGLGDFTCTLSNLRDSTVYYARAYAVNAKGIAYGEQVSWRTKGYALPTLSTIAASSITFSSAVCGGSITSDGNAEITSRGICYSTRSNPTISNSKVTSGSGTGTFTCNLTNLSDGTTYYARAYATNKKGTAYGAQISWTTKAYTRPAVSTTEAQQVSYTTATCGGNVTSDGGKSITSRGICYSTKSNPTIADNKIVSGSGVGSFSCILTNLSDNTTYYVRAYATNSKGTEYGMQQVFTTLTYSLPSVTTLDITDIGCNSASCGGTIVSDGGKNVISCGICYSTSPNPTLSDNSIPGNNTPNFDCHLSDLSTFTTYYVRAYATNEKGTAYGEQKIFGTEQPTFSIDDVSSKVIFSNGNLQYQPSTNTWRFAEHQYDLIDYSDYSNISSGYTGWIDLFGWGTGDNPTDTSMNEENYNTYVDWGNNFIDMDAPNTWFLLPSFNWRYILYVRPNADKLFGCATIDGIHGLVLLPDNWEKPSKVSFTPSTELGLIYDTEIWNSNRYFNVNGGNFNHNNYTISEWQIMETSGAVFLPAVGHREGVLWHNYNDSGSYWTATKSTDTASDYIYISPQEVSWYSSFYNYYGFSVRLVRRNY